VNRRSAPEAALVAALLLLLAAGILYPLLQVLSVALHHNDEDLLRATFRAENCVTRRRGRRASCERL